MFWSCDENNTGEKDNIVEEITTAVNSIAIDKNNTKWIGTDQGLFKSVEGGYELLELSDSGKVFTLLYEEAGNILWIGAEFGLLKATLEGESISDNIIPNNNLSDINVMSMHIDNTSKRWFGTGKGITLNDNETWKKSKFKVNIYGTQFAMEIEDFPVNSIATWDGDYFFATSGAKLYRAFNYNESVDAFSGATQWDPPYNGLSITDTMFVVFIDNEGKQWMGGTDGIQVHTGHEPKDISGFTYYYEELPDQYILTINQAPDGNIWVGTRKGLGIFNGSNWEVVAEGLPDLQINSIAFDKNGSAWIGTKKGLINMDRP
jgi:ligand-binding sensor domain-containing protein